MGRIVVALVQAWLEWFTTTNLWLYRYITFGESLLRTFLLPFLGLFPLVESRNGTVKVSTVSWSYYRF